MTDTLGETPVRTVNVRVDDRLPAVVVTLDQPRSRNALSLAMMRDLTATLAQQAERPEVHSIVLAASGPAFSSGHDLRELVDRTQDDQQQTFDACTELMQTVQRIPQPVVAAVQGIATAAGCQLVATCDLAVAAETATFATPGVRIGLFCSTPMVALSRNIGRKRAMEMLLTGRAIDARTAAEWGLVNAVVPADQVLDAALDLARQVAVASPLTVKIGKEAFYRQIDEPQDRAYELMGRTMAANAVTCDAQEGITAFLAKREPTWQGR
ncbi:MAG TPA: enoyl-CoA hydratase [Mycobacteriales bacterium]